MYTEKICGARCRTQKTIGHIVFIFWLISSLFVLSSSSRSHQWTSVFRLSEALDCLPVCVACGRSLLYWLCSPQSCILSLCHLRIRSSYSFNTKMCVNRAENIHSSVLRCLFHATRREVIRTDPILRTITDFLAIVLLKIAQSPFPQLMSIASIPLFSFIRFSHRSSRFRITFRLRGWRHSSGVCLAVLTPGGTPSETLIDHIDFVTWLVIFLPFWHICFCGPVWIKPEQRTK